MPYVPIHQKQLGRGTPVPGAAQGSLDCGPRSWQMGADAQSRGRVRPGVRRLRRRGQCTGPQPTSIDDARRALDGLSVPGRSPLRYYRTHQLARVKQAIRRGRPVHLAIDYGTWNDRLHRETGDPNYRGGHSILVFGQRDRGAGVEWLVFDPLEDGRRKGIERGPQWRLRADVVASARGLGGIWAGIIGGAHGRS